jgi:hypothetical protein
MPEGTEARQVKLLVAGQSVPWRREGRMVVVTVPRIEAHEVVAMDF